MHPRRPPEMTSLAIGYVRVSSEQQAGEKQTSLRDQRVAIEELAERLGLEVSLWFEDAGFSGATVAKRPALRELIVYCEGHAQKPTQPGYVLVLNDSRFGRFDDPDEAAHLRFALKRHGWHVRFVEADEIADPSLRHIMRAVGGAQASEYRRNLRANSTRGRIGTTKQGYWATRAPFGYRRAVVYPPSQARVLEPGVPKARGEKLKLVPGPEHEVRLVQEVFSRYVLKGQSMRAIVRWLNGIPGSSAGRSVWSGPAVKGILENHVYVGDIAARRRTAVRMEQGDYRRTAPEYVVTGTHEPLIARDLFARAQEMLGHIPPRGDSFDYRVRGLVCCTDCGEPFVGGGFGNLRKSTGQRARFYVCRGARDGICAKPMTTVTTHLLEPAVIEQFAAHVQSQLREDVIADAMTARAKAVSAPSKKQDLSKRRTQALRRRERLMAAVESGDIELEEVRERLAAIREELASMEQETVAVAAETAVRTQIEQLIAAAQDLRRIAEQANGPELRTLLHPWVEKMTFDRRTRGLTMTFRTLLGVLLPQTLRAGGSRKQNPYSRTITVVISPASAVTNAARRLG